MRSLTTTSYALLGLLALRPWSAYELTGFMRTSAIRRYWPRTQSRLYSEPKNLAAHGLVKATREHNGRRRRTVYRVTAKGRRALGRWLGLPPAHVQTWDEAMLKLMLVDLGTREQALATIRAALEHLVGDARYVLEFAGRVAHARGRFPERRHISALSARELTGSMRARLDYLRWADAWVRSWSGVIMDAATESTTVAVLEDLEQQMRAIEREARQFLD